MSTIERVLFNHSILYRIKYFVIETVIWRWILSGLFRLSPNPLPDITGIFKGKTVLMAASGPGDTSTGPSIDDASSVHAIDLATGFVKACRVNRPHWKVIQGDVLRLPYADGVFDVCAIYSSLHHIPADASLVLAELARVARGGRIVFLEGITPNRRLLRRALLVWWRLVDGGVHYYATDDLLGIARRLGLEAETITHHGPIRHMMLAILKVPARSCPP